MKQKNTAGRRIVRILFYGILISYATLTLIPFLWSLSTSFKLPQDVGTWPPSLIPPTFTFDNYKYIFTEFNFDRWFMNSVIVTAAATLANLFLNSLAGYALARLNFPGRNAIFLFFLATMMIPLQVYMIPEYILLNELGWVNTYQGMIMPFAVQAFGIFLMRQFFLSIPKELEEAARMDGLSRFGIFLRIILPLSKPALLAQTLFIFMGRWNDFLWTSIIASEPDMFTLTVGLFSFQDQYATYWNYVMAATVLMTLPTLILFFIFQRYFIQGIAHTGIK